MLNRLFGVPPTDEVADDHDAGGEGVRLHVFGLLGVQQVLDAAAAGDGLQAEDYGGG
jgi:hypothetical protein